MEHISEPEEESISDCLRIDGLESRLNAGADELAVGEMIVRSPEDLKAHMVAVQGEASEFGGFVCVHNILTTMVPWLASTATEDHCYMPVAWHI